MNATAYFIQDRALSLTYEAIRYPATADTVLAWLGRARAWAERHGMKPLAETLLAAAKRIEDQKPC